MAGPRGIECALDLARMPVLASSAWVAPPLPDDVLEVIQVAAAAPDACREAEGRTGASRNELVEASRFYLQQMLFRPDASPHRVLGLAPDASRQLARLHMGWLLQWLHPDRNSGLDAVYVERVLWAWRELSSSLRASTQDTIGPPASNYSALGQAATTRAKPSPGKRRKPFAAASGWLRPDRGQ